jgi:hypothetical protein
VSNSTRHRSRGEEQKEKWFWFLNTEQKNVTKRNSQVVMGSAEKVIS